MYQESKSNLTFLLYNKKVGEYMSTHEYNDLYLKCQDNGIYHMFVFDIINSKKMSSKNRYEAQIKMIELMN